MEDATSLRPTALADAHTVRDFIQRASGAGLGHETWRRAHDAAERLLENAQQPQEPPQPQQSEPLALERLPQIIASLKRADDDLFTEVNERCGALEARLDSLEARNQPLAGTVRLSTRPEPCEAASTKRPEAVAAGTGWPQPRVRNEDRHQGLSDPMG